MPQDRVPDRDAAHVSPPDRTPAPARTANSTRAADQQGIERLMDGLVPALVAKLATLNVGELEVHEGDWRVRLRRPMGADTSLGRRSTDRLAGRVTPGHDTVGAPAQGQGSTAGSGSPRLTNVAGGLPAPSSNGSNPSLAAVGPGRSVDQPAAGTDGSGVPGSRTGSGTSAPGPLATSPAVGVFEPGSKAVSGTRVRAGDRLGIVDMLGIPQDVSSPADGIVISVLAEAGTAVEYGQPLIEIEPAVVAEAR